MWRRALCAAALAAHVSLREEAAVEERTGSTVGRVGASEEPDWIVLLRDAVAEHVKNVFGSAKPNDFLKRTAAGHMRDDDLLLLAMTTRFHDFEDELLDSFEQVSVGSVYVAAGGYNLVIMKPELQVGPVMDAVRNVLTGMGVDISLYQCNHMSVAYACMDAFDMGIRSVLKARYDAREEWLKLDRPPTPPPSPVPQAPPGTWQSAKETAQGHINYWRMKSGKDPVLWDCDQRWDPVVCTTPPDAAPQANNTLVDANFTGNMSNATVITEASTIPEASTLPEDVPTEAPMVANGTNGTVFAPFDAWLRFAPTWAMKTAREEIARLHRAADLVGIKRAVIENHVPTR